MYKIQDFDINTFVIFITIIELELFLKLWFYENYFLRYYIFSLFNFNFFYFMYKNIYYICIYMCVSIIIDLKLNFVYNSNIVFSRYG